MICRLEQIYNHQRKLMFQFEKIELENGLLESGKIPLDMDTAAGQARLRNFAGRVTEEIVEAINEDAQEMQVELADVMHFFVELLILADIRPGDIQAQPIDHERDRLDELMSYNESPLIRIEMVVCLYEVIRKLWTATNYLKQKAWKQNKRESDLLCYERHIGYSFRYFLFAVSRFGITSQQFFDLYMGKAKVNQDRINSGV